MRNVYQSPIMQGERRVLCVIRLVQHSLNPYSSASHIYRMQILANTEGTKLFMRLADRWTPGLQTNVTLDFTYCPFKFAIPLFFECSHSTLLASVGVSLRSAISREMHVNFALTLDFLWNGSMNARRWILGHRKRWYLHVREIFWLRWYIKTVYNDSIVTNKSLNNIEMLKMLRSRSRFIVTEKSLNEWFNYYEQIVKHCREMFKNVIGISG